MRGVLETSVFSRQADAHLSLADREDLIGVLSFEPAAGVIVPGLGGIRKLRFAPSGRGKRGGYRVIYYWLDDDAPVLALLLYGKNEQANPTPQQRKQLLLAVDKFRAIARKE